MPDLFSVVIAHWKKFSQNSILKLTTKAHTTCYFKHNYYKRERQAF